MSLTIAQEKQAHRLSVAKSECYGFSIASAAILAPIPIEIDDRQPTACTDGNKIYFSSVFAETLNPLELAGTIIHEALHIQLMHPLRMLMLMERGQKHRAKVRRAPELLPSSLHSTHWRLPVDVY